jgi:hypothetical protein
MTDELLTPEEVEALDSLADIANQFSRIIGHGQTREGDSREAVALIHGLQNMILSQAAARRYPGQYRLLGESLHDMKVHTEAADPSIRCEFVGTFMGVEPRQCVLPQGHSAGHWWDSNQAQRWEHPEVRWRPPGWPNAPGPEAHIQSRKP